MDLSNIESRKEKIDKLIIKIIKESNDMLKDYRESISLPFSHEYSEMDFEKDVECVYALYQLKNYLNHNPFMQFDFARETYIVSDESIDIWLLDDFTFVQKFLLIVYTDGFDPNMIRDKWFEHDFMSIIERLVCRKRLELSKWYRVKTK